MKRSDRTKCTVCHKPIVSPLNRRGTKHIWCAEPPKTPTYLEDIGSEPIGYIQSH